MVSLGIRLSTVAAGTLLLAVSCSPPSTMTEDDGFPVLSGEYLGQEPPGAEPKLFAPGVVSTGLSERDVAVTSDGDEFYFGLVSRTYATIVVMKRVNDRWSEPEIAPFSTNPDVLDLEPHITPDGEHFLFLSTRPQAGQEPKSGWAYQDIWIMDRTDDGWSEPYNPGPPVNSEAPEYYPSVTRDGTIYFTREVEEGDKSRSLIFRAPMQDGEYGEAQVLPKEINYGDQQFNAFIDPEERYLIVCMSGGPDAIGRADYYVSFRNEGDSWQGPINMGEKINTPGNSGSSPYVSPDGRYFFFASTRGKPESESTEAVTRTYRGFQSSVTEPQNGSGDIYWVDAAFIEELRPQ